MVLDFSPCYAQGFSARSKWAVQGGRHGGSGLVYARRNGARCFLVALGGLYLTSAGSLTLTLVNGSSATFANTAAQ